MIGLVGANGTGKTTLAQAFAQKYELAFVQTSGSEVFAALGKDPRVNYPIEERIAIQEAILFAFEKQYAHARATSGAFIADRTPIDLAGYMLADIQRATTAEVKGLSGLIDAYVNRCFESASQWFGVIVLVQPGIPLVEREGKAPACSTFMEHLNALDAGLLLDPRLHSYHYMIARQFTNLEARIECLRHAVDHSVRKGEARREEREALGLYYH